MRVLIAFLLVLLINNIALAADFQLSVYFNLGVAERHKIVKCRQGGEQLDTEYHLTVFKDEPSYTTLGNLDFEKNVIGDTERSLHCNEGEFTLTKLIHTQDNAINLFIYLEEIYVIKDEIFKIANVALSFNEDYLMQEKYINELDEATIKTSKTEKKVATQNEVNHEDGELLYRIEIKRI